MESSCLQHCNLIPLLFHKVDVNEIRDKRLQIFWELMTNLCVNCYISNLFIRATLWPKHFNRPVAQTNYEEVLTLLPRCLQIIVKRKGDDSKTLTWNNFMRPIAVFFLYFSWHFFQLLKCDQCFAVICFNHCILLCALLSCRKTSK